MCVYIGYKQFCSSVNIGPIHLLAFSSEFYYFTNYGFEQIVKQYEWMEHDLTVTLYNVVKR